MRINAPKKEGSPLLVAILIIFTAGVVLGAVSYFKMPSEISLETREMIIQSLGSSPDMRRTVINDFTFEMIWLGMIWILGTLSTMAPFIAAITAIRGFIIGFSGVFILTATDFATMCAHILPQSVLSLPLMSIYSVLCMRSCMERSNGETSDSRYFLLGIASIIPAFLSSLAEGIILFLLLK